MNKQTPMRHLTTYDSDYFQWSRNQAELIRERKFDELDVTNIAQEIENLGRSEKNEIESRLKVLLLHLLKWQFQPEKRTRSWRVTLKVQRNDLQLILSDNPSLNNYPLTQLENVYLKARLAAEKETGLDYETFPEACPFTLVQIMDENFPL